MGILRGAAPEIIEPLTAAIVASGLKTVEITMNTPAAAESIKKMVKVAAGRLVIGAGTVLSQQDLQRALDSGATFIVLPVLVPEVVESCLKNKIPVFPGAFTPQEISTAWKAGATMVKVFPAKFWGSAYLKEIKGPFADIELLACGGVNAENIADFFAAGAAGVAFGASLFRKEWLERQEFSCIEGGIKRLIAEFSRK